MLGHTWSLLCWPQKGKASGGQGPKGGEARLPSWDGAPLREQGDEWGWRGRAKQQVSARRPLVLHREEWGRPGKNYNEIGIWGQFGRENKKQRPEPWHLPYVIQAFGDEGGTRGRNHGKQRAEKSPKRFLFLDFLWTRVRGEPWVRSSVMLST